MAEKARELLADVCVPNEIEAITVPAACAGAGIFLTATYENTLAGFSALGRRGLPAEKVAEEVVSDLLAYRETNAALERHLADQVLMPAALAEGDSCFSVERRSRHFTTVAWLVEQFGLAKVRTDEIPMGRGEMVTVERV
jgi:RNA 3'-terminal phosphate cyclase (ATP)